MMSSTLSKALLQRKLGKEGIRSVPFRGLAYIPRVTERRNGEAGPGGRSSNAGVKVAVFGAGGFLGRYVCSHLGTHGVLAYIGNRGDDLELRHLKPMFDLGRSRHVFYSPHDRDSMAEVIADADVVVNLIGKHYATHAPANTDKFPYIEMKTNFTLEQANVDIPRTIAELCTEMQVDNLIHVSAMAASPDAASEYSRMKYKGEQAVKEAYPWATIIRPTQLFGHEDRLLNWFANAACWHGQLPFIPHFDGGNALTQPVYVNDVAQTIDRVIDMPEVFEGKTIDCFGTQDFTYKELAAFVYDITRQNPTQIEIPKQYGKYMAKLLQMVPYPVLTEDQVDLWTEDCVAKMSPEEYAKQSELLTMADLGVETTPIEKIAFNYLYRFRSDSHFTETEGYHGHHTEGAKNVTVFKN